jgi:integrase
VGLKKDVREAIKKRSQPVHAGFQDDWELAVDCMTHSRADSTMRRYQPLWIKFKHYCHKMGVESLPANPLHVAMFLAAVMRNAVEKGFSYNVVKQTSAAIFSMHRLMGVTNGVTDHPLVANVRNCAQRILGFRTGAHRKEPVPLGLCVLTVERLLRLPSRYSVQVATFIMVCFAGLLRHDDAARIEISGVTFTDRYMTVHVPGRKNDQFRHGSVLHIATGSTMACPVTLTRKLIQLSKSSGPLLFKQFDGLRNKNFDRVSFNRSSGWSYDQAKRVVLMELAKTAGMSAASFTDIFGLHSFRSGGASMAADHGVDPTILQAHGGWRNAASMQVYIKRPVDALLTSTLHLGY